MAWGVAAPATGWAAGKAQSTWGRTRAGAYGAVPPTPPTPAAPPRPSYFSSGGSGSSPGSDPGYISQIQGAGPIAAKAQARVDDVAKNGILGVQGTGERWWNENQSKINAPGQLSGFLQGSQGRVLGQDYQPTNTTEAYNTQKEALNQPGQGTNTAWNVSSDLASGPTAGENMQTQAAGYFGGPNLAHNYAQDTAGFFRAPTASGTYAGQVMPGLQTQSQGETGAYGAAGELTGGPGAAETNMGGIDTALGGINGGQGAVDYAGGNLVNNSGDFNADVRNSGFAGQNTVGDERGYFAPGLRELSDSERLYNSGNGGLDFAYQREADKRTRELTNRMAATGVFGSGATARGMEEIQADIASSQARDMASLANQADTQRLGRTNAAQLFADASGKESLARAGLGLDAAKAADAAGTGNVNAMTGAETLASNEGLGKVTARTAAADDASKAMADRLFKGGQLDVSAGQLGLDRTKVGLDVANTADTQDLAKTMGGSQVATAGDQSLFQQGQGLANIGHTLTGDTINRETAAATTGLAADKQYADQLDQLTKSGATLDSLKLQAAQQGLSIEQYLAQATGMADSQAWQRVLGSYNMASGTQGLFEGRNNTQFSQQMQLALAQSGLVSQMTGKSADEQTVLMKDYINNQVATGAMTKQQGDQLVQEFIQVGGVVGQIATK